MTQTLKFRYLRDKERNLPTLEKSIPSVLEPRIAEEKKALKQILSNHSDEILNEVSKSGALLLRGFEVKSEQEFEQAITGIKGIRGMNSYFMAEHGRTLIDGTNFVFYTNKFAKTGGTLAFGGFHNENYYSTDVPGFICFYCIKKPLLGGETGLVDMSKVYEDLSDELKTKLAATSFHSNRWRAGQIAERYGISTDKVIDNCEKYGLELEKSSAGEAFISMYKPGLLKKRTNNQLAFLGNFGKEIPGLNAYLNSLFLQDYKGLKWTWHKLAWKYPFVMRLSKTTPRSIYQMLKYAIVKRLVKPPQTLTAPVSKAAGLKTPQKIATIFTNDEMKALAVSMHRHFASFPWKDGDIVIVDNLRLAHGGMPGMGSRIIRALLCNSLKVDVSAKRPGLQVVDDDPAHRPLSEIVKS
jgi:alpha-ketoglutarate-dependent taurine dioxygenase